MKITLTLLLAFVTAGCSIQESSHVMEAPQSSEAAPEISVIQHPNSQIIETSLAGNIQAQLIMGLWLHLGDEKTRLTGMLNESLSPSERQTIQRFIQMVEEQQRATWQGLFETE